jgi:hypothetical protein
MRRPVAIVGMPNLSKGANALRREKAGAERPFHVRADIGFVTGLLSVRSQ